ncbi:two-component system, OmpR family, sensor histidine kinase KdpD [Sphingomonas laterariae]|uniref:histidine kinase n=1 Tax=Edaphosphingomonas laterariae TaxID=861865 RepID=A0A239EV88_9SPHN|nr:sensor histidine kinase KdpD [Sphingomonas laterariae]SNS48545.1 two-component system, OmpR family, sensor histidine kinase KdpD [Sphingomonas laterariae]
MTDRAIIEKRPSPDALLRQARREGRGQLKIFLGAAPGVGKTFAMLAEGAALLREGEDVVVAVVETHGRAETEALVEPFEIIPRRQVEYHGRTLTEMDLDEVLARKPALALVDEYAHTNVDGGRHPKRWQDVDELLDAGIDVFTTLNIQHVESLTDVVASFTRVRVRETVPDSVFEDAEIKVVDLPPDELIERLKEGKVYVPQEASRALGHFFSKPNLSALREMALRRAALSIDRQMLQELDATALPGTFGAGERILVAVSEQPGADALIRAAKRLADGLRAPWMAVHIETPRSAAFDEEARRRIAAALALAATLGATIATVPAENVVTGLRNQIEGMRATQIVIGRSQRSWWFELRHGSVVEAIVKHLQGVAVHVIPSPSAALDSPQRLKRLAGGWGHPRAYATIALLLAVTTAVAALAQPWIGAGAVDLLYLVPVIVAASLYGLRPGLIASIAAALAFNFFFLAPTLTFTIADPQSVLTMLILTAVAAFTSNLAGRLRNRAKIGVRGAQESAALAAFSQTLARASDRETTARSVCDEVARLLEVRTILLADRDGHLDIVASQPEAAGLDPIDRAAADWAWARGELAGCGSATLPAANWQFHPLKTGLGVLAVLGVARDDGRDPVPADRAVLLSTLVGQAALAHERLHLEDEMRSMSILKERDRLRAALLSSIGHDLRTPLTGVTSAIEAIRAEHPDAATIPLARAELARLRRFLDNLVDMVRLDAGALKLALEPIDLTDAAAGAVHDLKETLRGHHIDFQVPPNLPLVRADARLLHHMLINLLANAVQHGAGQGPITLAADRTADAVRLMVRDRGPGLEPGAESRIFETFAQGTGGDRHGGSGLGLAIVKGFAEAMGIAVIAANHPDGGAEFTLVFGPANIVSPAEDEGE